jgi:hypothetical protein
MVNTIRGLNIQEQVSYLVDNASSWIMNQRTVHRALAEPLAETTLAALQGFFDRDTLERVRIRTVPAIDNPPFYSAFEDAGESVPLDFDVWAAITFGDVILVSESQTAGQLSHSILFHELVHVVQFKILGIHEFARRYVSSFVQGGLNYMTIPLESIAFDLQGKFEKCEAKKFPAEEEIQARLFIPGLPYVGRKS